PLDRVEARHITRQVGQRDRELLLLVEARDLDDELHAPSMLSTASPDGSPAGATTVASPSASAASRGRSGSAITRSTSSPRRVSNASIAKSRARAVADRAMSARSDSSSMR